MQAEIRQNDRTLVAELTGDWKLQIPAPRFDRLVDARAPGPPLRAVAFDTAALGRWDSSLLTFLLQGMSYCEAHDLQFREDGLPDNIVRLLALARAVPEKAVERGAPEASFLARLGTSGLSSGDAFLVSVTFVGEVASSISRLLLARASLRWRDFSVVVQSNAKLESTATRFPEIPTTPSLLAAFGTRAGSLVGDVLKVLFRVNEMLEEVNMQELNRSVVASAQAVEQMAEAPELRLALAEVSEMSARFNSTLAEMQLLAERLGGTIDPLQQQIAGTNEELVLMRQVMEETRGVISADSGIGYEMEGAMASLKSASDALRTLILSLERNPDMLIRGKPPTPR